MQSALRCPTGAGSFARSVAQPAISQTLKEGLLLIRIPYRTMPVSQGAVCSGRPHSVVSAAQPPHSDRCSRPVARAPALGSRLSTRTQTLKVPQCVLSDPTASPIAVGAALGFSQMGAMGFGQDHSSHGQIQELICISDLMCRHRRVHVLLSLAWFWPDLVN